MIHGFIHWSPNINDSFLRSMIPNLSATSLNGTSERNMEDKPMSTVSVKSTSDIIFKKVRVFHRREADQTQTIDFIAKVLASNMPNERDIFPSAWKSRDVDRQLMFRKIKIFASLTKEEESEPCRKSSPWQLHKIVETSQRRSLPWLYTWSMLKMTAYRLFHPRTCHIQISLWMDK